MKFKLKNAQKQVVTCDEGFDEYAFLKLGATAKKGQVPVYVLESNEDETFFFSLSPISLTDLRATFSTDEFILGRKLEN